MSMSQRYDIAIVGGGLVGACLAEELALLGVRVVVADAGSEPGHATPQAAGVAVPSLRYLTDAPFYRWLEQARAALEQDILRLEPDHGPFSLTLPIVRAMRTQDLAKLPQGVDSPGLGTRLPEAELAQLHPVPRLTEDRAAYLATDGLVIGGRSYLSAVRAAAMQAGAEWIQGRSVTEIEDGADEVTLRFLAGSPIRADRVVVAAGAWTGQLVPVPVGPQRGQLVLLNTDAELGYILSSRLYLAPLPSGEIVVGATEEDTGFVQHCTAGGVAGLLSFAVRTMPELSEAALSASMAGLRPVSATRRPLIGRVPTLRRVFVSAGHGGHGLISSRLSGQGMAQGLVHGDWEQLPRGVCPAEALTAASPGPRSKGE
jgi:glycine oxidase